MEGSINNITLDNTLLVNLYGHSLVELENSKSPKDHLEKTKATEAGRTVKFLGSNLKNITILVSNPGHAFLPEDHLAFITRLLGACALNTGDVAIVNTSTTIEALAIKELKPSIIISFGTQETLPAFVIQNTEGIQYLNAVSLEKLTSETEESKALKGRLWGCLKQMFGV